MVRDSNVAPAAHQPSKAELEEDVRVDASPEALAWTVTRGGAERRDPAKSKRADSSALRVADYLVAFSLRHGDPISNLKLQKLLYYAEGWYLAFYSKSLFSADIQAWPRGPVVYPVWKHFNGYRWKPISRPTTMPEVPQKVGAHIKELMAAYGDFSAYTLERMTHQEKPWIEARQGLQDGERSNRVISRNTMRTFFSELASVEQE